METSSQVPRGSNDNTSRKPKPPVVSAPPPIDLENIEEMRRQEGIEDVELRLMIRELRAGDHVNLRFLTGKNSFETWTVRITSIRGSMFRGKLASRPAPEGRAMMQVGAAIVFTTDHIHSLARAKPAAGGKKVSGPFSAQCAKGDSLANTGGKGS